MAIRASVILVLGAAQEMWIMRGKQCPEMYDSNGMWKGSRLVGGNYTLYCAPGFEVSGQNGSISRSMTCPPRLIWPQELRCINVDDCIKLKHGCGALGICLDLVDGYDCNCENGFFTRHYVDQEIVCGPEGIDQSVCRGHTCGAYGVCIDLVGNTTGYESLQDRSSSASGSSTYRCECTDGFFDNGVTCERQDCGEKEDQLGKWQGSTKFGGEYSLRCPEGSFIWGGALQEIVTSCPANGKWLTDYWCVNPLDEEAASRMATMELWIDIASVLLCVTSAALAAGLTLGLATLEPFGLQVILATRPEDCLTQEERNKLKSEQAHAARMLPLVKEHHLLLVTLLLFNTVANEALPVFLDRLMPSWAAVLLSVTVVLICGEILPSAVFTGPNQFAIASALVPLVQLLELLFFCVAHPIANVLDQMFKDEVPEDGPKYSRAELRALLTLHGPTESLEAEKVEDSSNQPCGCEMDEHSSYTEHEDREMETVLARSELSMMNGVLNLRNQTLASRRCFTLLKHCRLASGQEPSVDVVERCALGGGDRCVVVLHEGSTASTSVRNPEEDSDTDVNSPMSPKLNLRLSAVAGCLQLQDVLKGGAQRLSELCKPLVCLDEESTLLDALGALRAQKAHSAVVVRPCDGSPIVRGVVHLSQLVSQMLREEPLEASKEILAAASPSVSPGVPRAAATAQRRHPLARVRSNVGEASFNVSQNVMRFRKVSVSDAGDPPQPNVDRSTT